MTIALAGALVGVGYAPSARAQASPDELQGIQRQLKRLEQEREQDRREIEQLKP